MGGALWAEQFFYILQGSTEASEDTEDGYVR